MEAKELRIGNYVFRHMPNHIDNIDQIQIGSYDLFRWNDHVYNPIPLTEDWFVKFGCKKIQTALGFDSGIFKLGYVQIGLESDDFVKNQKTVIFKNVYVKKIKYVHQFQNLIFALTGTELKTITK